MLGAGALLAATGFGGWRLYAHTGGPRLLLPPERPFDVGFASLAGPDTPLSQQASLGVGGNYLFWVEVGRVLGATRAAAGGAATAQRLTIALFGFPNEIDVSRTANSGEVELRPDGTAVVVRQAVEPQGSALTGRRLFFPVSAPAREGPSRVRCSVYCRGVLVRSQEVEARISARPALAGARQRRTVDYRLTRTLDPVHLNRLTPHRLSVMLNRNSAATHGFRIFGENGWISEATLDDSLLTGLIEGARGSLRRAAWGSESLWTADRLYRYENGGTVARLTEDLTTMAKRGYRIYHAVVDELAGGRNESLHLRELMRQPAYIQVATKDSARHTLPASLIYDHLLDTGLGYEEYTLCKQFEASLHEAKALDEQPCFTGHCPNRDAEAVICPSGFWGYRHWLGVPLSVKDGPDIPAAIGYTGAPEMLVGVSTDETLTARARHEQALRDMRPGLGWSYAATRAEARRLLKQQRPHLVYFYAHGGVREGVPVIYVGSERENGISPDNLRAWDVRWQQPQPLVFINGCRTTAVAPEQALEFVSAFVAQAFASGVIGTEITVFESLATTFAEASLGRFLRGATIGEAVRGARLDLLKACNPLGLAYVPFVFAGLTLEDTTATAQAVTLVQASAS